MGRRPMATSHRGQALGWIGQRQAGPQGRRLFTLVATEPEGRSEPGHGQWARAASSEGRSMAD